MIHRIVEFVKTHPKTAAGIAIGVLLLFIIVFRGGSSSSGQATIVAAQPTDTSQNTALQVAQLNAQVQTNATNQAAAVQLAGINAAQTVQSQGSTDATNVALAQISSTADTTKYVTDLQAQVANNQTAAAVNINDSQMSAATQIATITAQANQALAGITSEMNANNNATNITLSGIAAGVANNQIAAGQTVALAQNATNLTLGQQSLNDNYYTTLNRQSLQYQLGQSAIGVASAVTQATGIPYYLPIQGVA